MPTRTAIHHRAHGKGGNAGITGASPYTLALRVELAGGLKRIGTFDVGDYSVEVGQGADSIWAIVRRAGRGALAIRAAYAPGGFRELRKGRVRPGEAMRLTATSAIGRHHLAFCGSGVDHQHCRVRHWVTPDQPLVAGFMPRDLYPLGEGDDPLAAGGRVEAAQRGPNTGLVHLVLTEPAFGQVLYVQDFTCLNPYYRATGTTPVGTVGGEWPELGYLAPTSTQDGAPAVEPLPAGAKVMLSDAIVVIRDTLPDGEPRKARQFVQMLGNAYAALEKPRVCYRDWVWRAERTLRDLDRAPEASCTAYGHRYARPYTDAEYPDSMVQMTLIAAIHDYARWTGKPIPLEAGFAAGMEKFYDPALKTLRRYLPDVGDDKNADEVDAWYLYHPLRNLAQLALDGEEWARDLFLRSVDYGIEAAHHFNYIWPIQYDVRDFSVVTATRGDEKYGQTDVGGFYAYVMILGFELTGEQRFLDEARAAIDAARGMRFDLEYQANLTVWGAAASMRLWRITGEPAYHEQTYAYLASFLHNCQMWESEIGAAAHLSNFLGATALHDAPYMAMYECFDSFMGLQRLLTDAGPDFEPAARTLIGEYCRYALYRAWYYYPDALPPEALATEWRNGHVDATLSFPVEDLYPDGQPAGQVGQEIYGAGSAFVFAARAFHRVEGAAFQLYCDHLLAVQERTGERAHSVQLTGAEGCTALLAVIRRGRKALPRCKLTLVGGDAVRPVLVADDRIEFHLPAHARATLTWSDR